MILFALTAPFMCLGIVHRLDLHGALSLSLPFFAPVITIALFFVGRHLRQKYRLRPLRYVYTVALAWFSILPLAILAAFMMGYHPDMGDF